MAPLNFSNGFGDGSGYGDGDGDGHGDGNGDGFGGKPWGVVACTDPTDIAAVMINELLEIR